MLEDRWLVKKVKAGDGNALRRIYKKYKYILLTIATGLMGDATVAEDILHDVFVCFAEDICKFQLTGSLKAYFVRCVTNQAIDRLRAKDRKMLRLSQTDSPDADSPTPERIACEKEQFESVASAMAQLPFQQRQAIILHLKAGMSFREIAKLQCTSINTTQGRYRYGMEKLRSILPSEE
jgi:RNA polymerase sigma-70 factor (ECF subfamily)